MANPRIGHQDAKGARVYFIAEDDAPPHLCGNCKTPNGKSLILCKNEPKGNK